MTFFDESLVSFFFFWEKKRLWAYFSYQSLDASTLSLLFFTVFINDEEEQKKNGINYQLDQIVTQHGLKIDWYCSCEIYKKFQIDLCNNPIQKSSFISLGMSLLGNVEVVVI